MSKKLIPQHVTNIGIHKNVCNARKGEVDISDFTDDNFISEFEKGIMNVRDMSNKLVVTYYFLDDALKEGDVYDLLISQNMKEYVDDGREFIDSSVIRQKLKMKLVKIEIPTPIDEKYSGVVYVFEKDNKSFKVGCKVDNEKGIKDCAKWFSDEGCRLIEKILEEKLAPSITSVTERSK